MSSADKFEVTLTVVFRVSSSIPCGTELVNKAEYIRQGTDVDLNPANSVAYARTTVVCNTPPPPPPPAVGCIEVTKQAFDEGGSRLAPTPAFTFRLDNQTAKTNDASGRVRYDNVTPGRHTITETLLANWTQTSVVPAGGSVNVQAGTSCAQVAFNNRQSPQPPPPPPPPQTGCVEVRKEAVDAQGNMVSAIPAFTFLLDGQSPRTNDASGRAFYQGITPGTHTITEQPSSGWTLDTIIPQNGSVSVQSGTSCAQVVVRNRQIPPTIIPPPPPPPPQAGCIDIIKETYDTQSQPLTPVPQFTYWLDHQRQTVNDSAGRARYDTVSPGFHVVTEDLPSAWNQLSVSPENGSVFVESGRCATVVFKNRQIPFLSYVPPPPPVEIVPSPPPRPRFPDLSVEKTASASEAFAGDVITYTLSVRNDGDADAEDVILEDRYPSHDLFIDDAGGASRSNGNLRWRFGTVERGEVRIVRYRAEISSSVRQGDSICNEVTVRSRNDEEDDDRACVTVLEHLPQTGVMSFQKPPSFLTPVASPVGRPAEPLAWVITTSAALAGAGWSIRKLFLIA